MARGGGPQRSGKAWGTGMMILVEPSSGDASARVSVIPNCRRRRPAEKRRETRLKRFVAMVEVVSRPGGGGRGMNTM